MDLKEQEQKLINDLYIVKDKFIQLQEQAKFSIRKDVIKVALKDALNNNNTDYTSLSNAIKKIIEEL